MNDIEREELKVWNEPDYYFWQVLTGEVTLEEMRDNLLSFRNSVYYSGTNPKYKKELEEESNEC